MAHSVFVRVLVLVSQWLLLVWDFLGYFVFDRVELGLQLSQKGYLGLCVFGCVLIVFHFQEEGTVARGSNLRGALPSLIPQVPSSSVSLIAVVVVVVVVDWVVIVVVVVVAAVVVAVAGVIAVAVVWAGLEKLVMALAWKLKVVLGLFLV